MLGNGHGGCGRRLGETHRWKHRQGAPGRPHGHLATAASGERAYWGASHGLLIDDFYRHVRAGKHFWIDAPAALETLRVIQAAYDQSPDLGR